MCSVLEAEEDGVEFVDGVGLFETEMYVSRMHGGHGGGKTSSFKRCLFLKNIGDRKVAERLVAAVEGRLSPLCYLHLLQGGRGRSATSRPMPPLLAVKSGTLLV